MYKFLNNICKRKTLGFLHKTRNVPECMNTFTLKYNRHLNTTRINYEKLFIDKENKYAYGILPNLSTNVIRSDTYNLTDVENNVEFEEIARKHWRTSTIIEIKQTFQRLLKYCVVNNISLSDLRFNNLVDGLIDNVEHLTYEDMMELLSCLTKFPHSDSYAAHNFYDVWTALDDICYWRMNEWSIEQQFHIAEMWYKWNLGRKCNYLYKLIEKYEWKTRRLTREQLVHIFFYLNVCRKIKVAFEYENIVQQHIDDMTVDEMAVISMGHFKSQTKIKSAYIIENMIDTIIKNTKTIHEVSLTAILKIIRFSTTFTIANRYYDLLDALIPEIDRLSILCCIHIAILGTTIQVIHNDSLKVISQKVVERIANIDEVRLKDIERILLALTMGNYDPKTNPDIFNAINEELHKDDRLPEINQYPRSFVCALHLLTINNIYPKELINRVLDTDFIVDVYGHNVRCVPRELLCLDLSLGIECSDYDGNRLSIPSRYKTAKWLTECPPNYINKNKYTAAEKLILNVIDDVKEIVGGSRYMCIQHILPHFSKADIVVCMNKETRQFEEPRGSENYVLGDVMKPFDTDKHVWYAIVIVGLNLTIHNTSLPVGLISMKLRQLRKIGYSPVTVVWHEYTNLNKRDKRKYLLEAITGA